MATEAELIAGIRAADRAGDSASVRALGVALQRVRGQAKSKDPNPIMNTLAGAAEGVVGLADIPWDAATGLRRMINSGLDTVGSSALRAVGADKAADWWSRGAQRSERVMANSPRPTSPITNAVPVPQSGAGKTARLLSQLAGGMAVPFTPKAATVPKFPTPPRAARNAPNTAVIRAGQRQSIPVRRPDAIPSMRGDMATAEASQYGGPVIARTMDADKAAIQSRLAEVAGPGHVQTEAYNLGQQVQNVGKKYIEQTGRIARQNYQRADELANGTRISPRNAVTAIDDNIAELEANGAFSNAATIKYLQGLKSDLMKDNGFSVTEFQGLRSAARKAIKGDQALTASDAERRLGNVVRAFSDDARTQLPRDAASALDEADAFYADRMGFIGDVLQKGVLGRRNNPMSPERAAANLQAMAKNRADYDTFTRFWGQADPATQEDFAATFANNLGTARNGEFGLGRFASDVETVPQNIRQAIYGEDGAQSLDDLRTLALAKAGTQGGLNNSRSGVVFARNTAARVLPSLAAGSLVGGPVGAVALPVAAEGMAALLQMRAAKSLLNPEWSNVLAQQAGNSGDDIAAYASRFPMAASSNPFIRGDLGELLSARYISPLAADEGEQKKKKNRR